MFSNSRPLHHRSVTALCALAFVALPACSDGEVDLGGGVLSQDLRQRSSRCTDSPLIEGDVIVTNQRELDALVGCEEVTGNLRVQIFEGADISPLSSLRVVGGALSLGDQPAFDFEDPEESAAIAALEETGFLPSLRALAALESASTLQFQHLQITDLTELESLESLENSVFTFGLLQLQNLRGLENLELDELILINSPSLTSLEGLVLADSVETLMIDHAPALTNVDALSNVGICQSIFMISGTGIEALPELALTGALQISIDNNANLVDISGLAPNLLGTEELYLAANPQLEAVPSFPQLVQLDFLTVLNNGMETLRFDIPALERRSLFVGGRDVALSTLAVEVSSNQNLRSFENVAGFEDVQVFTINENPLLEEVDLGTLERANLLVIDRNPSLTTVAAPSLATVDTLELIDNPNLDASSFDDVLTFTRTTEASTAP
jgi:hypothetical protein